MLLKRYPGDGDGCDFAHDPKALGRFMIDPVLDRPSTASLLGEALAKTSQLFGSELQLVRLELAEKVTTAIKAIVAIVVAAVFLIVAMIFLLQGVVALLVAMGWSASNASFVVGGGIAVIALVAIVWASQALSGSKLKPSRTIRQINEDGGLLKDATR